MTRARLKQQPTDRTLVTEFKMTVADIHLRKRVTGGSIAKRVNAETDFIAGDAVAGPDAPFKISNIKTAVLIQGFQPFKLNIRYGDSILENVPCSGLFVHYGELDEVEVLSDTNTRFTYARS